MNRFSVSLSVAAFGAAALVSSSTFGNDDLFFLARVPSNTVMPGITYSGWNYNQLDQINAGNVSELAFAASWVLGSGREVASPLVVGGTMYVAWLDHEGELPIPTVAAIDLSSGGQVVWTFAMDAASDVALCCDALGLHFDGSKILFRSGPEIYAIDATTGEAIWRTLNLDSSVFQTDTRGGQPGNGLVANDFYIVGGGNNNGVRGSVTAIDKETGQIQWVFYTMGPNNEVGIGPRFRSVYPVKTQAPARDSWFGDSWRRGGGAVSGNFTYDPDRDYIYYGTDRCTPWNPDFRREWGVVTLDAGQIQDYHNNYCTSTLARSATTGELIWAYNITPASPWGLDEGLAHLLVDAGPLGFDVTVLAAANGWVYAWDRSNGRIVNNPWMYSFSDITMSVDAVTGLPEYDYRNWPFTDRVDRQAHLDLASSGAAGEFVGTEIEYCPGASARSRFPDTYSPQTGLVYTVADTSCSELRVVEGEFQGGQPFELVEHLDEGRRRWFYEGAPAGAHDYDFDALQQAPEIAVISKIVASSPLYGPEWAIDFNYENDSPLFSTAGGLIFQGDNGVGAFRAFDSATGEELWAMGLGATFNSSPVSFIGADGRQYVAVLGIVRQGSDRNQLGEVTLFLFAI